MRIDSTLLDSLTAQAKASPRLRMNYDLRTSQADSSQRMLNAMEPGTVLPIHRHQNTTEVVAILRGSACQYFYDDQGNVTATITIAAGSDCVAMSVEKGRWHKLESLSSGTIILECKDGPYEPIQQCDILTLDNNLKINQKEIDKMNTDLLSRIKEWIEFQQRSCIDGKYPISLIAYELHVPVEDVKNAIKDDPEVKYQIKD